MFGVVDVLLVIVVKGSLPVVEALGPGVPPVLGPGRNTLNEG